MIELKHKENTMILSDELVEGLANAYCNANPKPCETFEQFVACYMLINRYGKSGD